MRIPSQAVSVVLHPLVMPTLGAFCYYNLFPSTAQLQDSDLYWRVITSLISLTLVLPLLSVLILMRIGKVSTMFIEEQKERNWPLLVTAAIYMGASWMLNTRAVPGFIQIFLFGAVLSMVIAAIVNIKWKISLHMIGIGGFCGGLTILYVYAQEGHPIWLSASFLLAGLLGTARLLLAAHTSAQILVGFLLGFFIELGLGLMLG